MRATVLLADSAQSDPAGKVHALGLGWTVTSTPTPPMALVVLIEVDWTEANRKIPFKAELLTADGHNVTARGPLGEQPISLEGEFEAGRPAGIPPGLRCLSRLPSIWPPGCLWQPGSDTSGG